MGISDDIKNTAQDLAGKAKEAVGKVTDNDKLVAEGKAEQLKADVKKTGQDVKDTLTGDK
ncbi:CsbD family protein [Microbacterium sp.]|uniref:CsbD family protein n=1 Tax=Microbacterium sp. TaxID=51671 RepID=UPI00092A2D5B|nr:CsbD family protein [Microbacterium sp.]OJU71920.1 MAG: general stress protein CsbD [Microbacterium sp. 70-38]MBN9154821.1 CsbD family protein [Microbacterium sp.]MBN9182976.1 CsbD family protein [Microbacterium sp.]MBN9184434.1 CsbD family protein [Microbacterium sp.]MBN9194408.1 CsbD family protein [Microbacterium sp.]